MSKWPIRRLGEHAKAKGGKRLPKGMKVQDSQTPYPYLRVVDMTDSGTIDLRSVKYISEEAHLAIGRYTLTDQDVYISIAGTIGRVGVIPPILSGANLTENAAKITNFDGELSHRFLACYLQSPQGQDAIHSLTVGAAQPKLALFRIEELLIPLPPVAVQDRVANVLSSFDDLIENNRRRIEVLEETAQAIYREWFVHFRFPGHENATFVDSPLGPIPEGWEVSTCGQELEVLGGGTPSKKEPAYWFDAQIPWFTPSDLTRSPSRFAGPPELRINELGLSKSSARLFPAGSVMMTSRATLGVLAIAQSFATTNQGFIVIPPDDRWPPSFIYEWLSQSAPALEAIATGATFKEITKGAFKRFPFMVPSSDALASFRATVEPLDATIKALLSASANLAEQRDLLLPRLVSGEIDVSDFELDAVLGGVV